MEVGLQATVFKKVSFDGFIWGFLLVLQNGIVLLSGCFPCDKVG